ncbi:MAG: 3-hydroxyacyl-CoA dehydrogenase [Saprospiraceae bacterium]|nr:MAG: 3-hydroxyacyl-CoA dehydrogenase [Saprospiraceae bacterium]
MIKYQKDTDNIVTLIFDMEGRNVNVINHELGNAFIPVIKHLQLEKAKGKLKGIILTSAKKSFLSGGDLEYLYKGDNPEEIFRFTEQLKTYLRDLERPGVPVVAALNGSALGTGFEVALACHHRIAIDNPKIRLGNPEVSLGLMPGAGGIIRLMWLLGIEKAFSILTSGQRYAPQEALAVGIIDELASDQKEMLEKAKEWLLKNREGRRPWDQDQQYIPGGTAGSARMAEKIRQIAAELASRTYNNYPAPQSILNVLCEGSKVDFDTACRIESRHYTQLLRSKEAKNMIKTLWFDFNSIKGGENRPKGFGKFRPKKVGIIGAGLMGSGIALACLKIGLNVVLKDVSKAIAERGREIVHRKLKTMVDMGNIQADEMEETLQRITTTEVPEDFESCDLVIEAVFENEMVKQKVTREAEAYLDDYSIFASNTISIPITKLAKASLRPANYVGLHFFHPADQIPMVEIVRGDQTSEETIARAFDFVNLIKKVPIIVKDDWGFYAARVRNTYILEGITMLEEGYAPALIENIGVQSGMSKGALTYADDLGIPLIMRYENQAAEHYGSKYIQHPAVTVLDKMINELKRSGRNKRSGFYEYQHDNRYLWPDLSEHFPTVKDSYDRQEITERFFFVQVLEALWCLQEGIIHSVSEANLGSIYGWGFPAFKGGVIQFIQDYGLDKFKEKCKVLEKAHGPRFKLPGVLVKLKI